MKTLKTIQFVCLSLMTGFILLSACKKDELEVLPANSQTEAEYKTTNPGMPATDNGSWREDFATANSLALRWNLFGTSQPQWVYYSCKRFGLFDNNGSLPGGSFAVSKAKIGYGNGYTIESDVYIDVKKPGFTTICPQIGVTRTQVLPSEPKTIDAGISMKLMYIGTGEIDVPEEYRNRTFVLMSALLQNGIMASSGDPNEGFDSSFGDYAFPVDAASNGWHSMKIVVNHSGQVSFFLDNKFVWSPGRKIENSLMKDKNVILGYTSPGSTGKAYHDYVKVSYPRIGEEQVANGYIEPVN